ncbi:hypothetical protein EVAR_53017_1 [Eumeta japonica]|uniref:Uncharacterized protein n=1 Tax=Eumeta variegata TaxID=151549 RepID=A0A4C1XM21_EUMVA|nr:hypothetical protein EVAR_53017_1 [Eumeta japonica]
MNDGLFTSAIDLGCESAPAAGRPRSIPAPRVAALTAAAEACHRGCRAEASRAPVFDHWALALGYRRELAPEGRGEGARSPIESGGDRAVG